MIDFMDEDNDYIDHSLLPTLKQPVRERCYMLHSPTEPDPEYPDLGTIISIFWCDSCNLMAFDWALIFNNQWKTFEYDPLECGKQGFLQRAADPNINNVQLVYTVDFWTCDCEDDYLHHREKKPVCPSCKRSVRDHVKRGKFLHEVIGVSEYIKSKGGSKGGH